MDLVRVLVVDDSAYIRKVIKQMLSHSPFIDVVGIARDGEEALALVKELNPDVVTLDLIMPNMDGLGFLKEQMARRPIPVVVVSIASESGETALEALDLGAVDFMQKPTALASDRVLEMSDELIEKVKNAANTSFAHLQTIAALPGVVETVQPVPARRQKLVDIVVLGISTGGPQALRYMIPQLPADFPVPLAMVIHMPVGYTELYAQRLNQVSPLKVSEAREGDAVKAGVALLAPAGRHLGFKREPDGTVTAHLSTRPFDTPHRPSVDVLFRSAADVYGSRALGVVMTGMGSDATQGAAWIKAKGGLIYTEAEETCVVYGMPQSVVKEGLSDRSVPLHGMAQAIMEVV